MNRSLLIPFLSSMIFAGCQAGPVHLNTAASADAWFVDSASVSIRQKNFPIPDSLPVKPVSTAIAGIDTPVIRMTCPETGLQYSLGLRTPKGWDVSKKYPLIVYLHGGNVSDRDDKGSRAWDMYSFIADTIPVFVASPSANRYAPWWTAAGMERVLQAVRYMTLHYPIDPDRIILAGVSDGAAGCFLAAQTIPAPFAGFIAVSGYGGILTQFNIPIIPEDMQTRPFLVLNNGNDRIYPAVQTKDFAAQLKAAGVNLAFRMNDTALHGFDYKMLERDSICALIDRWRKPHVRNVIWAALPQLPICTDNIVTAKFDPAVQVPLIRAEFKGDVIELNSSGVNEVIFALPSGIPVPKACLVNAKKFPVEDISTKPEARAMRVAHFNSPTPPECNLVRIVIKKGD